MGEKVRGWLLLIGGGEDKEGRCRILRRVVELAGGGSARLVVVTVASSSPDEAGEEYSHVFRTLGAGQVDVIPLREREDAGQARYCEVVRQATGFFFTGGDQLRITSTLGGTLLDDILHRRFRDGMLVAGTSAGAAAMSDTMIIGGQGDDAPRQREVQMCPGLGFLEEVVIDQHFAQRGRIGRLLSAVARNPYVLGLGIDEDTAVIIKPDATLEVLGSHTVTVIDGRQIMHTNVTEGAPQQSLAISNVLLHVLSEGYRFDLQSRRFYRKDGEKGNNWGLENKF